MSPVEASRGHHAGRAALVSLVGVTVLGVALWLATLAIGGRDSADLKLGDQTFKGGKTSRIAAEIADRGPILYGDVSGRKDRDMILQHRQRPREGLDRFPGVAHRQAPRLHVGVAGRRGDLPGRLRPHPRRPTVRGSPSSRSGSTTDASTST